MFAKRRLRLVFTLCVLLVAIASLFFFGQLIYLDPQVEINPGRRYSLEFWDYPLPLIWEDGTTYQEVVQEIIADFRDKYPNVTINYHPLSFSEGPQDLAQALGAGKPPDIYAEPFPRELIHHRSLQVPITRYLVPEEDVFYHTRVMSLLEAEGDIWAWPSWVSSPLWVGNRQILEAGGLDLDQVQTLGWNWGEFQAFARRIKENFSDSQAFFIGPEVETFCSLLNPNGLTTGMDKNSCLSIAEKTSTFFYNLYKEGLWQAAEGNKPWLQDFWEGRLAILGPVNTWVIRGSQPRTHQGTNCPDPVFLPPPHSVGDREYLQPSLAQVCVFRQRRYRGADTVKAAMEFAHFFSQRKGSRVAPLLWALPAYAPWDQLDEEENELSAANVRFLLRSQDYILPPTPNFLPGEYEQWQKEVLAPYLQKLLQGEIAPREFAARICEGIKE